MFKKLNFVLSELRKFYIKGEFIESKSREIINKHCSCDEKYSVVFKKPTLLIKTNNSILRSEIMIRKSQIIKSMNKEFLHNSPTDIRFVSTL